MERQGTGLGLSIVKRIVETYGGRIWVESEMDCWCNARWFTRFVNGCGVIWISTLKKNTYVIYRNRKGKVSQLAQMLKPKWRKHLGLRAVALCVYLPGYGSIRLVVTRNGHGRWEYIVTSDLKADLTTIVRRKRSRWDIETVFKDACQAFAGFAACQCRVPQAMVRHVALVLLTYMVLNELKVDPSETAGDVKERLQLEVIRAGGTPLNHYGLEPPESEKCVTTVTVNPVQRPR